MKGLSKRIKRFRRVIRATFVRKTIHISRKIRIPGFEGISLWEILFFFGYSIRKGLIGMRASALAFHFFLALIPFGLVLVVLSENLPFFNIEHDIIPILGSFIPESLYNNFVENIHAFQHSSVNSLVSIGFIVALYFTSNGFNIMIKMFNQSKIQYLKRNWIGTRITSFIFVLIFIAGILMMFLSVIWIRKWLKEWGEQSAFVGENYEWMFTVLSLILVTTFLYFAIAMLYYWGPSKRKTFRFFSAGATLSTLLIILISEGYSQYVQSFARYNELYGSLGTILALMLWIYLISFALLIGFELNTSIHGALNNRKLDNFQDIKDRYDKNY